MNRATPYRHQPEHGESGLLSYFLSVFRKYAGRDFFYMRRSVACFFFFALLFTMTAFADTSASDMNGYLTKPIDVEKMMKTIASFL